MWRAAESHRIITKPANNVSVFWTVNKMRQCCLSEVRTYIHIFYSRRKGRTQDGKMVQWNNRERMLPKGHRAPRDTSMSFWSKSFALISEQDEKNSSACSWNECYDASQITRHTRGITWHKTARKRTDLLTATNVFGEKCPKLRPSLCISYILLSHLPSSAQIFSPVQKGNKEADRTARSSGYKVGRVRFKSTSEQQSHCDLSDSTQTRTNAGTETQFRTQPHRFIFFKTLCALTILPFDYV